MSDAFDLGKSVGRAERTLEESRTAQETEPVIESMDIFREEVEEPVDTELTDRLAAANAVLPHLRLGQLIVNAFLKDMNRGRSAPRDTVQAMFFTPDEELVEMVERYVNLADKT